MTADTSPASELGIYACPTCKRLLRQEEGALRCLTCSQAYPIREGIPDYILEELSRSADPVLRRMRFSDPHGAHLRDKVVVSDRGKYLRRISQPIFCTTGGHRSQRVQSTKGRMLDIGCGPGIYDRRIASPTKEVVGNRCIHGMLRQGAAYGAKEGNRHVRFAPARVEALPFEDGVFDAALCSGSLHLFTVS
jgi:uncharacterized protein YbaR (Trm112 family)